MCKAYIHIYTPLHSYTYTNIPQRTLCQVPERPQESARTTVVHQPWLTPQETFTESLIPLRELVMICHGNGLYKQRARSKTIPTVHPKETRQEKQNPCNISIHGLGKNQRARTLNGTLSTGRLGLRKLQRGAIKT